MIEWSKKHVENTDMERAIAKDMEKESPRVLRRRVHELLGSGDLEQVLSELRKIPPRKAINPLISVFYDSDPELRSKAISAFGQLVADLANEDQEEARVVPKNMSAIGLGLCHITACPCTSEYRA